MAQVRITMQYDVPEGDSDPDDKTGLTEEAYEGLHEELAAMGMDDITFQKK
jgi:hypothetical protein